MRLTAPLYEGDSVLRSGPAFGADETATGAGRGADTPAEPATKAAETVFELSVTEIEARARAMRAAYISAAVKRLWDRFEAWLEKGRRARDEAYLARAANLSDLEARMRKLERDGYVSHI
jgi:hypothetical protein